VTVEGRALYEYRVDGNGPIAKGEFVLSQAMGLSDSQVYALTIEGVRFETSGLFSASELVENLKAQIVAHPVASLLVNAAITVASSGSSELTLTPQPGVATISITDVSSTLTLRGANPRPIRFAEVRVTDKSGALVQCAETDGDGIFRVSLPKSDATFKIAVTSRAANARNTAYVMDSPYGNQFYSIEQSVVASEPVSGLLMKARADSTLEGGAFNILDQILNAQDYLRASAADCVAAGFTGCTPFTVAPIVNVYWTPGLSPARYVGQSGAISFYLNGRRELYLLGGLDGNTTTADMDHFDNSVIVHEYGHFIEDQYGRPDSPGGSHNGSAIIDPRLAWGEGWADFFQAAVTGQPNYRDTYGTIDCPTPPSGRPCTGVNFNESLDNPTSDIPSPIGGLGEGNFREFSVARALWDALKTSTSLAPFAEIWTVFAGPSSGMRASSDAFKHIGRFHVIQRSLASASDWSLIRESEQQAGDLSVYATPISLTNGSCSTSPMAMNMRKGIIDNGSFASADQFRNSDFYVYHHPGGRVSVSLELLSADGPVDLDLYLLKRDYVFGRQSDWAGASNGNGSNESVIATLPAGDYMIHVMAFTGIYQGTGSSTVSRSLTYRLLLNGAIVCPGQ
jgi:hypothetical protein